MDVRTKRVAEIWGTIGGLLIIGLLFAYCSSSSTVNVPKADKQANISAAANANSIIIETEANDIHSNAVKAETASNTSRTEFNTSKTAARRTVKRDNYEKIRNTPVVVDDRDLDARDRVLLTKLRKLYPANK